MLACVFKARLPSEDTGALRDSDSCTGERSGYLLVALTQPADSQRTGPPSPPSETFL